MVVILTVIIFIVMVNWFASDGMGGCMAFLLVLGILILVWAGTLARFLL